MMVLRAFKFCLNLAIFIIFYQILGLTPPSYYIARNIEMDKWSWCTIELEGILHYSREHLQSAFFLPPDWFIWCLDQSEVRDGCAL